MKMSNSILCVSGIKDTVNFIELLLKNEYEVKVNPVNVIEQDGIVDGFEIIYSDIAANIEN